MTAFEIFPVSFINAPLLLFVVVLCFQHFHAADLYLSLSLPAKNQKPKNRLQSIKLYYSGTGYARRKMVV